MYIYVYVNQSNLYTVSHPPPVFAGLDLALLELTHPLALLPACPSPPVSASASPPVSASASPSPPVSASVSPPVSVSASPAVSGSASASPAVSAPASPPVSGFASFDSHAAPPAYNNNNTGRGPAPPLEGVTPINIGGGYNNKNTGGGLDGNNTGGGLAALPLGDDCRLRLGDDLVLLGYSRTARSQPPSATNTRGNIYVCIHIYKIYRDWVLFEYVNIYLCIHM